MTIAIHIFYCFFRHRFKVLKAETLQDLRRGLAATTEFLYIIDRAGLEQLTASRPLRRINSKYMKSGKLNGYGSKGYGTGWVFPLSEVRKLCQVSWQVQASGYGCPATFAVEASDFVSSTFIRPECFVASAGRSINDSP